MTRPKVASRGEVARGLRPSLIPKLQLPLQPFPNPDMDGINRNSTTTIPQPRLNLAPTTTQRHKMDISAADGKCAAI